MTPHEITFTLPDPSYASYTWLLQDEHIPASQPPLLAGGGTVGLRAQRPSEPPARLSVNGYAYMRGDVNPMAALSSGNARLPDSVDELTRWQREWLPEIDKLVAVLERFDPAAVPPGRWEETLESQEKDYSRVFIGVHRTAVLPVKAIAARFEEEYAARFAEHRRHDAMALLQGFPNRSLDRACALWDLGRLVRSDAALARSLDRRSPLPETPVARHYQKAFDAMLQEFGYTTDNGLQDLPTWREGSPIPLALIRAYAKQDESRSPQAAAGRQRQRRVELEAELRSAAAQDASLLPLARLLEMAQTLLPNLEDHNLFCDQRCIAASRLRWLAIGAHLRGKGIARASDDVFFYHRPELLQALESGPGLAEDEVSRRRALQQRYRAATPPPHLGRPPAGPGPGEGVPQEGTVQGSLRGVAASPGSHSGRARVMDSLEHADRLRDGDILVTRSTTPPWTPFFGVIGALVTSSGGALSHGAVVAREFGIPAVVGAPGATAAIRDGATVTVDGTAGIVVIGPE